MWNWVNFIAAAIGAIGGPAALYSILSQRPRKPVLRYEVEYGQAFPSHRKAGSPVSFKFDNEEVDDPYEVNLYLRPEGRRDIGKDDFDGQDFLLSIGTKVVAVIDHSSLISDSVEVADSSQSVTIAPQILKRGELVSLSVLTQGKPVPKFEGKLRDVDQEPFDHTKPRDSRLTRVLIAALVSVAAIMLVLSGVIGWMTAVAAERSAAETNKRNAEISQAAAAAKVALGQGASKVPEAQDILSQIGKLACPETTYGGARPFYRDGYYYQSPTGISGAELSCWASKLKGAGFSGPDATSAPPNDSGGSAGTTGKPAP